MITPGSWEHLKCGTPHEHDWACFFRPTAWLPEQPFSSQSPDSRKEGRAEASAFMASFLECFFLDPQDHDAYEVLLPEFIIPKSQLLSSCGLQWVLLCTLIYGPSSLLVLQWTAQSLRDVRINLMYIWIYITDGEAEIQRGEVTRPRLQVSSV